MPTCQTDSSAIKYQRQEILRLYRWIIYRQKPLDPFRGQTCQVQSDSSKLTAALSSAYLGWRWDCHHLIGHPQNPIDSVGGLQWKLDVILPNWQQRCQISTSMVFRLNWIFWKTAQPISGLGIHSWMSIWQIGSYIHCQRRMLLKLLLSLNWPTIKTPSSIHKSGIRNSKRLCQIDNCTVNGQCQTTYRLSSVYWSCCQRSIRIFSFLSNEISVLREMEYST